MLKERKEKQTCCKISIDTKRLHLKLEGVEREILCNAQGLLLLTHVRVAQGSHHVVQSGVPENKALWAKTWN